jgi:hypothetical protein
MDAKDAQSRASDTKLATTKTNNAKVNQHALQRASKIGGGSL